MKLWYQSKTLWTNLLAIVGIAVQSQTGYIVPLEAQTALLAIGNLVLRVITKQPIDWSKVKVSGLPCFLALVIAALVSAPLLSGCSLFGGKHADEAKLVAELAVRAATGRVLEQHPEWAEPVELLTSSALDVLDGKEPVAFAALETKLLEKLNIDGLSAEDQALVVTLVAVVRSELQEAIASGGGDPNEARLNAAEVFTWINQTAAARK